MLKVYNENTLDIFSLLDNKDDKKQFNDFYTLNSSWCPAVVESLNKKCEKIGIFIGKNNDIIIDIGAHCGFFSIMFNKLAKKIYAIEPTFQHIKLLSKLICQHYRNIVPKFCAISDKTEIREFFCSIVNNTQNSLLKQGDVKSLGLIQCYSLVDFMNNNGINKVDFVKMDIEGGEMQVIMDKGFKNAMDRIKVLFVEVHNTGIEPNNNFVINYDLIYNKLLSLNLKVQKQDDAIIAEH